MCPLPPLLSLSQLLPFLDGHCIQQPFLFHISQICLFLSLPSQAKVFNIHISSISTVSVCLLCNQLVLCYRINLLVFMKFCLFTHTQWFLFCACIHTHLSEYTQLHFHYTFISPRIEFASSLLTPGLFVALFSDARLPFLFLHHFTSEGSFGGKVTPATSTFRTSSFISATSQEFFLL